MALSSSFFSSGAPVASGASDASDAFSDGSGSSDEDADDTYSEGTQEEPVDYEALLADMLRETETKIDAAEAETAASQLTTLEAVRDAEAFKESAARYEQRFHDEVAKMSAHLGATQARHESELATLAAQLQESYVVADEREAAFEVRAKTREAGAAAEIVRWREALVKTSADEVQKYWLSWQPVVDSRDASIAALEARGVELAAKNVLDREAFKTALKTAQDAAADLLHTRSIAHDAISTDAIKRLEEAERVTNDIVAAAEADRDAVVAIAVADAAAAIAASKADCDAIIAEADAAVAAANEARDLAIDDANLVVAEAASAGPALQAHKLREGALEAQVKELSAELSSTKENLESQLAMTRAAGDQKLAMTLERLENEIALHDREMETITKLAEQEKKEAVTREVNRHSKKEVEIMTLVETAMGAHKKQSARTDQLEALVVECQLIVPESVKFWTGRIDVGAAATAAGVAAADKVKHALEDMASEDEARKWAREAAAAAKTAGVIAKGEWTTQAKADAAERRTREAEEAARGAIVREARAIAAREVRASVPTRMVTVSAATAAAAAAAATTTAAAAAATVTSPDPPSYTARPKAKRSDSYAAPVVQAPQNKKDAAAEMVAAAAAASSHWPADASSAPPSQSAVTEEAAVAAAALSLGGGKEEKAAWYSGFF
uniref:Uncharacterized protein n=1 Tax=Mantoniella antarctica TaxID=81844 RepID=A0A7S0SZ07_9CHLO|mmetsp:Transcript_4410/g.10779  ORF Transcript_4410/g.10779 Transcript_4410/m.10779 type:complete len:672 (+) Transcript_4410:171-2186(+)